MKTSEYYNVRKDFQEGDLVFYRGHGIMSKLISYFDSAFYIHVGVVKKIGERLFTVEMWTHGIQIVPLSRRMDSYDEFCVIRVKNKTVEQLSSAVDLLIEKIERDVKYDYGLLPRVAFYKKTGIDLVGMGSRDRNICSELAQTHTNKLSVRCYEDVSLITPQDFLRYKDDSEVEVHYDLSPKI